MAGGEVPTPPNPSRGQIGWSNGHKDQEPDARSVVNQILVAATALLLTTELLFFVALFAFLLSEIGKR